MLKLKRKLFLVLTAVLFTITGTVLPVYAASTTSTSASSKTVSNVQKVDAYTGVKIIYNGKELTDTNKPYIINNTTYIPLRMLMSNFNKGVGWDDVNKRVIITDVASSSDSTASAQVTSLQTQNAQLQSTITALNARIQTLEDELNNSDSSDTSLSDIKSSLSSYFEDAGENYFSDSGIDTSISLSGDEDDLVYTVKLDFTDSDDYSNLEDVSESKIKTFLNAVKSKINSKIDGTDYEDADITGKLYDNDHSSYYVKYNSSSYTFSWDDDSSDTSLSDIKSYLNDYFDDAGDNYFDDDGIDTTISLSGDEDDLYYTVKLDFSDSDYSNLEDVSDSKIKTFLNAVKSRISYKADGSDYEDANIKGKLYDNDHSSYYVTYDGDSYDFSW